MRSIVELIALFIAVSIEQLNAVYIVVSVGAGRLDDKSGLSAWTVRLGCLLQYLIRIFASGPGEGSAVWLCQVADD